MNLLFEIALVIALANIYIKNYALCFFVAAIWYEMKFDIEKGICRLFNDNKPTGTTFRKFWR